MKRFLETVTLNKRTTNKTDFSMANGHQQELSSSGVLSTLNRKTKKETALVEDLHRGRALERSREELIYSWICSFGKHLPSSYCVPGIHVCAEDTVENRANKVPVIMDFRFWLSKTGDVRYW